MSQFYMLFQWIANHAILAGGIGVDEEDSMSKIQEITRLTLVPTNGSDSFWQSLNLMYASACFCLTITVIYMDKDGLLR